MSDGYRKQISSGFKADLAGYTCDARRILTFLPKTRPRRKNIQYLQPEENECLQKVLDSDQPSVLSLRNKAIETVVFFTGLQAHDLASLTFDDIDWEHDRISIRQNKIEVPLTLPLTAMVGNAIYDYISLEHPAGNDRHIFHTNVYKYKFDNPECNTKVFTEPLSFARTSQVRTDALNTLILGMAMFMSNEGASNVLELLGITVSNDTIQRLYDQIDFKDDPNIEEVGIDDVATRKGKNYATAVYDLKDHHLIALLDGRDGETLKEWLKQHKKIRLVARDRASAYANAINETLPDCVPVADRFHLLQNIIDHLKDIFKSELPNEIFIRNGQVLDSPPEKISFEKKADDSVMKQMEYDNSPPIDENGKLVDSDDSAQNLNSAVEKNVQKTEKKNNK